MNTEEMEDQQELKIDIKPVAPKYTGDPEVDQRIDFLRKERDLASNKQKECQEEIDQLFVDTMLKINIVPGQYIRYDSQFYATIGRVSNVRRTHDGITIDFDLSVYYNKPDRYDSCNSDVTLTNTKPGGYNNSVTVVRGGFGNLRKSSREELVATATKKVEEILSTTDQVPQNQLKLNL